MTYRFSAVAEEELYDSTLYYTRKNRILGIRFVEVVTHHVSLLQSNPHMGMSLINGRRKVVLQPFPYSLIYQVNEGDSEIVIVAVIHHSRHPDHWKNHVQEEPAIYQLAA